MKPRYFMTPLLKYCSQRTRRNLSTFTLIIVMFLSFPPPVWALSGEQCGNHVPPTPVPEVMTVPNPKKLDDSDNDGVNDADDLCPTIGKVKHEDSDGDGVGNACDPCPSIYGQDDGCPIEKEHLVPAPLHKSETLVEPEVGSCSTNNGSSSFFFLFSFFLFFFCNSRDPTLK